MPTLPGSRIRNDGIFGAISSAMSAVDTTISSPDLAELDTVSLGNHAIITLDPNKEFGAPEIIMVTLHTPASATATVQRGMYGTTPRNHPNGTLWVHAAVVEDFAKIVTSSTRPTDPYEGQLIYETDTNQYFYFDGTSWQEVGTGSGGGSSPITLGYAQATSTQVGFASATATPVTGLQVTVTVPAGRRLKITAQTSGQTGDTTSGWSAEVFESGVVPRVGIIGVIEEADVTRRFTVSGEAILSPSAGTHTYYVAIRRFIGAGSLTLEQDVTAPGFILVEDITGDPLPYDPASVPVGQLGYAQVTVAQAGVTTGTNLNNLSVNISVPAGRVVKITGYVFQFTRTAGTTTFTQLQVVEGATPVGKSTRAVPNTYGGVITETILSPSAGSHTYFLRYSGDGTVTMEADAQAPAFILVEDITPTPAPSSGAPGSTLGYAEVTANQGPFTAATDIIGLSSTVTVPAGRRLRISCEGLLQSTVADDTMQLAIQEGATVLQTIRILARPGGSNLATAGSVVITPSSGSHTYKIVGARSGGTGNITLVAAATAPAFILVEDITGSVWPAGSPVTAGMIASEPFDSWMPVITQSNTPTQTINRAVFTKVGRLWTGFFHISLTSAGTALNAIQLTGFPPAASAFSYGGSFRYFDSGTTIRAGTIIGSTITSVSFVYDGYGNSMGNGDFVIANGDVISGFVTFEAAS